MKLEETSTPEKENERPGPERRQARPGCECGGPDGHHQSGFSRQRHVRGEAILTESGGVRGGCVIPG